jgi:hypothetical protein
MTPTFFGPPKRGSTVGRDKPAVDLKLAEVFLARLGSSFTFQTFDDSQRHRNNLTSVLHGSLAQHGDRLTCLNAEGAGIFVMVNAGDGQGRKAGNVQRVRACFADLDGAPLEPVQTFPVTPHLVVESSPGRWHAYWLMDGLALEQFKAIQRAIAQQFNADPKVCDLPRVMRVPGFFHNKGKPFLSRIVKQYEASPYAHDELVEALGLDPAKSTPAPRRALPAKIPVGERNDTLFRMARGLVHEGLTPEAVAQRLQKVNAGQCTLPLSASEVESIAANASAYGSEGFAMLPHALLDSPAWKALPTRSQSIVVGTYRQLNKHNNGKIALPWCDFKNQNGLERPATFYRFRALAVDAGVLVLTEAGEITQQGKKPARFAIATEFLPAWLGTRSASSASNPERAPKNINRVDDFDVVPLPHPPRSQAR